MSLTTRVTNDALGSRINVINSLRLIIELSEWIDGKRTDTPDLTSLHSQLTVQAITDNREDLALWRKMFSESLANYQELLDMSPAEWAALRKSDIVGLEGMIRQATSGILAWV